MHPLAAHIVAQKPSSRAMCSWGPHVGALQPWRLDAASWGGARPTLCCRSHAPLVEYAHTLPQLPKAPGSCLLGWQSRGISHARIVQTRCLEVGSQGGEVPVSAVELCTLGWKCACPVVALRGILELPAGWQALCGPVHWSIMTIVSVGWQPGRVKSEFLLQEPCILGWIFVHPAEVHRGTLELLPGVVNSGDLCTGVV